MCLHLRDKHEVPYNKNKTRWKVVKSRVNKAGRECYRGPYTNVQYSKVGVWMRSTRDYSYYQPNPTDIGFHVFVTKRAAEDRAKCFYDDAGKANGKVVKVEVDGFVASGTYGINRSETWQRMKIL